MLVLCSRVAGARGVAVSSKLRQTHCRGNASHLHDPMSLSLILTLSRMFTIVFCIGGACWVGATALATPTALPQRSAGVTDAQAASAPQADAKTTAAQDAADARITRGKKLVLKD